MWDYARKVRSAKCKARRDLIAAEKAQRKLERIAKRAAKDAEHQEWRNMRQAEMAENRAIRESNPKLMVSYEKHKVRSKFRSRMKQSHKKAQQLAITNRWAFSRIVYKH